LTSISLDGKQILNHLASANSSKCRSSNVKEGDLDPSRDDKVVVHDLKIGDVLKGSKVATTQEGIGGQVCSLQLKQKSVDPNKKN
jgi:hypothetical protein